MLDLEVAAAELPTDSTDCLLDPLRAESRERPFMIPVRARTVDPTKSPSRAMRRMPVHVPKGRVVLLVLICWPVFAIWRAFLDVGGSNRPEAKQSGTALVRRNVTILQNGGFLSEGREGLQAVVATEEEVRRRRRRSRKMQGAAMIRPEVGGGKVVAGKAKNCEGRRIYMYEMPARFNRAILERCGRGMVEWLDFCAHARNGGFGEEVHEGGGWYATDFYMLEVIFHERMKGYECLAAAREEADAVYVPYYGGLDALRFLYGQDMGRAGAHGEELAAWLAVEGGQRWRTWRGADHFMVLSRTAWDFSRSSAATSGWGTSLLLLPPLSNLTSLILERPPPSSSSPQNLLAIPYPSSFHPPSLASLLSWLASLRSSHPRPFLFSFAGSPRPGPVGSIRQTALDQCLAAASTSQPPACSLLDCREIGCAHKPLPIRDRLLLSEFCLQPPGDSPTRRSTFDGLISGCIPVFFHNDSAYTQYTSHLPSDPDQYSVFISHQDLQNGVQVRDVLSGYSRERIAQMRENIIKLIPAIIYVSPSAAPELRAAGIKDAFDLSVDAMLRKAAAMKATLHARQEA